MLLWAGPFGSANPELKTFVFALGLIALGKAGKEPSTSGFLEHQLSEKVQKERAKTRRGTENKNNNGDKDKELSEQKERSTENSADLWWRSAWISGAAIAVFFLGATSWPNKFRISALLMGAMHLLFYSGFPCYYPEKGAACSPLTTIYNVFKAAIKRRGLPYPLSEEGYYSKNNNHSPNALFCPRQDGQEVHLSPPVPLFTFLDKAAVKRNLSHNVAELEAEEKNGELCTVEQVREVKSFYPVIPMGFYFFAYSLVVAAGNTYFVEQSKNLKTGIGRDFEIPISFFFVLKSFTREVVVFLVSRLGRRIGWITVTGRIGIGMFCAVLCSIAAWQVELRRLSLIKKEEGQDPISLHILVLTPQYVLLGLMEGVAERGLEKFYYDHVPESMKRFGEPFAQVVLGIGKLNSILCVLVFHSWFKESMDTSHLDSYFLFLAILSWSFFWIYVFCADTCYNPIQAYAAQDNSQQETPPIPESEGNSITDATQTTIAQEIQQDTTHVQVDQSGN